MFGRKNNELSTVSEYIDKKSRLILKKKEIFRAKMDYALHGEHQHYFSKQDVYSRNQNARCKICGMLLSEFKVEKRIENLASHLQSVNNRQLQAKGHTQSD